jgi:hypothetical protein
MAGCTVRNISLESVGFVCLGDGAGQDEGDAAYDALGISIVLPGKRGEMYFKANSEAEASSWVAALTLASVAFLVLP